MSDSEREKSSPAVWVREERVAALAATQHGIVTRAQLLDLGVSSSAVSRRSRSGRLRRLHGGVYLVWPIESARSTEMAAVLAGGAEALLSHTSAIRLWGLADIGRVRPLHVTTPRGRRGRTGGIVFHSTRTLMDDERAVVDSIPVTAPGRTIIDAAGLLGSREMELALAVAEREALIGPRELARLLDRYPGRRGTTMLRSLLSDRTGPRFTRSEAERRCLDLLRAGGLPRPHTNVRIGPYELDLFWPEEGVAIEVDGREHHSSRARFEGDRRKDNWLRARGIEVIRLSWRQITREATPTVVQVGQTLALARARRLHVSA